MLRALPMLRDKTDYRILNDKIKHLYLQVYDLSIDLTKYELHTPDFSEDAMKS